MALTAPRPVVDATTQGRFARGLRRLSTGLLAYGAIGSVLAIAGLVALILVAGRLSSLADRTALQVTSIVETVQDSATALSDAGASAVSFSVTLERTPPSVRQAALTVGNLEGNLRTVEGQLGSLSILGSRPLANVAQLFGQMATDLDGLDDRLTVIADDLEENKARLLTNADSLERLGERLSRIADDLEGGIVEEGLGDLQAALILLTLALVAWTAVPAVGALILGLWLRRLLAQDLGLAVAAARVDALDAADAADAAAAAEAER